MPALPALPDLSGDFYLPLSEGTARRVALNMLAGEHASEFTTSDLLFDPALVCWSLAHLPPHNTPSLSSLVSWTNEHDWIRAFNADVNPLGPAKAMYDVNACRKLAKRGLKRALAAAASDPQGLESPNVVTALTKKAAEWFALLTPQSSTQRIPACFPKFRFAVIKNGERSGGPNGSAATRKTPKPHVGEVDRAKISKTWVEPGDWCRLVIQLAKTLARSNRLQRRFEETLDEEKLCAMRELAYGASHEINNPLANISTRAQMLMRDESDPQRIHNLASITHQAFRAHEMINDMMLFAKPPDVSLQSAALTEILQQSRNELDEHVLRANVTWNIDASCDKYDILADTSTLVVALKAILQNSIEAFEDGGTITIRAAAEAQGRFVLVRIADSGPGVPDSIRRRVFDPFYSGREAGRGLGFGLPKAWRIIQQHGGQLTLEHSPQHHTEFVVRLKAASSQE